MIENYSFQTDNALRIERADESLSELTGLPLSELIGRPYYDVFPRLYNGETDAVLASLAKQKNSLIRNYCLRFATRQMIADVKIRPSEGEQPGHGAKIIICPRSTCQLANKLHNSQRLIDIGKIASILAHGVRNPLNAIKGAVVYLGEKYAGEPTLTEFTRIMHEEISRLDSFISRFLSTSIPDMGTESDINSVLRKIEVFTFLQAQAGEIRPEYSYRDVPPAAINSFQLEQAVLNIINNAIEAMAPGGKLAIRTFAEPRPEGEFVVIEVSDTGPGIQENRIKDLSKPVGKKGRGFGLFITREILKCHGGLLEIKSVKDAGTTVRLLLPVKKQSPEDIVSLSGKISE